MRLLVFLAICCMASRSGAWAQSPSKTIDDLLDGNRRFMAGEALRQPTTMTELQRLSSNQHPRAIVLCCADSRVSPELIFDQSLGSLFVVRVAGNILDDAILGSIEDAIGHLGTKLVVVLGHEGCGAVGAAIHNERSAHLAALVDAIEPAFEGVNAELKSSNESANESELTHRVVKRNVQHVVRRISSSPLLLKQSSDSGDVRVVGMLYSLSDGRCHLVEALRSSSD